ncbi:MAG: flagellar hook-basal body complex protein FliE [Vicinamibacterales bacterium]
MAITPIGTPTAITPAATPTGAGGADAAKPGFGDALRDLLDSVDDSTGTANEAIGRMLDGTGDIHEAMIALQKADVMLQMTVQVRNKLVQAYQDIMRMPV